jgi:hypothetical protein
VTGPTVQPPTEGGGDQAPASPQKRTSVPMPEVSQRDYALNVLYTTASRLRAMCNGDDWDVGLREAAAFIEFRVCQEVRDA